MIPHPTDEGFLPHTKLRRFVSFIADMLSTIILILCWNLEPTKTSFKFSRHILHRDRCLTVYRIHCLTRLSQCIATVTLYINHSYCTLYASRCTYLMCCRDAFSFCTPKSKTHTTHNISLGSIYVIYAHNAALINISSALVW